MIWSRRLTRAAASSRSAAAQHGLAHVGGLEHGGVAGLLEDLLDEVALALERPLDDRSRRRRARRARCAPRATQRACSGEIQTCATREPSTSPVRGQPSTSAIGSRLGARLVGLVEHVDALDRGRAGSGACRPSPGRRRATYQPSRPLISAYGSTRARRERVLVLARSTRARSAGAPRSPRPTLARDRRSRRRRALATSRPSWPISPSARSIFSRAVSEVLGEVRRRAARSPRSARWPRSAAAAPGGRTCPSRAPGRPRSRRRLDLGVEHVGAAAEVDDVEHADVLAQLLLGDLQPLADLARPARRAARAAGLDQHGGERDEAGEALGADRRPPGASGRGASAASASLGAGRAARRRRS